MLRRLESTEAEADARPPWPTPAWTRIETSAALSTWVEQQRAAPPAVLGLWVATADGGSRHDVPPREREALAIAVAVPAHEDTPATAIVVDATAVLDLCALSRWLSEDDAPYVVMHDSQATLHPLQGSDRPPHRVWAPARRGDTRIAAHLLAAAAGRTRTDLELPACVDRVLEHRLGPVGGGHGNRGGRELFALPTEQGAALAASTLVPMMQALTPLLRRYTLTRPYELETALVPAVIAMERTGFGIDAVAFQRIADDWARERRSDPPPERIARLDKLLSTYAHWPRDFARRGRIHCRLHPLAAESGRFSCTDPNLQQVPGAHTAPGLRACFVPAPGYVLVVADYAQIELRVAAHLAPCEAMKAVFRDGRDPHRATAATITGKPESEITTRERKLAKAVNFGFLFGMGARRFASYAADSYGVEVDDAGATQARRAFLSTFPGIAAWHRRVGDLGRGKSVTVRTAMGRRKRFAADRFSFNAALNIPVQGTAAEGFKQAMIDLHARLSEIGGRGVLVVHDEYIAEVPIDRAEEGCALVKKTMEDAMATIVTSVPIEVDARTADAWA